MRLLYKDHPELYEFLCTEQWFIQGIDEGVIVNGGKHYFITSENNEIPFEKLVDLNSQPSKRKFLDYLKEHYPEAMI